MTKHRTTPRTGHISVTFDASNNGIKIDSNPQVPLITQNNDQAFTIEWALTPSENTLPGWGVELSNVAPCNLAQLPEDYRFRSEPIMENNLRTKWRWTFTRGDGSTKSPKELTGHILYDVFCVYKEHPMLPIGPSSQPLPIHVASFRQNASMDPTLILPAKEGGG